MCPKLRSGALLVHPPNHLPRVNPISENTVKGNIWRESMSRIHKELVPTICKIQAKIKSTIKGLAAGWSPAWL